MSGVSLGGPENTCVNHTEVAAQLQPIVARWECRPSVSRVSSFFQKKNEKSESRFLCEIS